VKFNQLRLAGFKSFLEPTELLIKDGLTGIVGPNGCGKSNLVEALRWVMGEASARNMRGDAMDDVIFAGTVSRPARNMAEVALYLDNKEQNAPDAYNSFPEIDVTRRIRRDTGSDYRINGKISRAKDVQRLFADMSTGAHSTAIVSQGRVGSLINAKPKDRRHLLEEAAGITGLHSRRREAELRLQSAENNLKRIDDTIDHLNLQLASLKRQSRQAARYSNLSRHIRKTEALVLYCKQENADRAMATTKIQLKKTNEAVDVLTEQVVVASATVDKASDMVAPLRKEETAAFTNLHQIVMNLENLALEKGRLDAAKKQLEDKKQQIFEDSKREKNLEMDAALTLKNLETEKHELQSRLSLEKPLLKGLQKTTEEHLHNLITVQSSFDRFSEALAVNTAQKNSLETQQINGIKFQDRLQERLVKNSTELNELIGEIKKPSSTEKCKKEIASTTLEIANLSSAIAKLEKKQTSSKLLVEEAREHFREAEKRVASTTAEIKALESLLYDNLQGEWDTILTNLSVKNGYEVALGAALGEELEASLEEKAPAYWRSASEVRDIPSFVDNIPTLDTFVTGEAVLQTRLSLIGVVLKHQGPVLAQSLRVGQRLVSKEGDLWRWDGYVRKAGAKTPAALRLEQRNRLAILNQNLLKHAKLFQQAREQLQTKSKAVDTITEEEKNLRTMRRSIEQTHSHKKSEYEALIRNQAAAHFKRHTLDETEKSLKEELKEVGQHLTKVEQELSSLPKLSKLQTQLDMHRRELEEERQKRDSLQTERDDLSRESASRKNRISRIEAEKTIWIQRQDNMVTHLARLEKRSTSVMEELLTLSKKPTELAEKRLFILEQEKQAIALKTNVQAKLIEAETVLNECNSALLLCQNSLSTCREIRVQHESDASHAKEILENLAEQIFEKLECTSTEIRQAGGIGKEEEIPPITTNQIKLDRLKKERDGMGPVNLRAQIEATEVEDHLSTLSCEKSDLEAAIHQLHQAIRHLNKGGRMRLLLAFEQVNTHFQSLFKQVFGGGHAHLTLTESDDPLIAGLEIMASPPGKNLQLMSLLSGGEQALTAVALLFAVFLTNPAPICVLDEVDAPLDDVNVQRLCNLLDQIANNAQTRFLVVTHHPITMARMDRLFGVTMAERGISQLVSVDLGKAQQITEEEV